MRVVNFLIINYVESTCMTSSFHLEGMFGHIKKNKFNLSTFYLLKCQARNMSGNEFVCSPKTRIHYHYRFCMFLRLWNGFDSVLFLILLLHYIQKYVYCMHICVMVPQYYSLIVLCHFSVIVR